MAKERSTSFRGKVVSSSERLRESKNTRVYLEVPKGIKTFKFPDNIKEFQLDFLPYIVTSKRHAERDDTPGEEVAIPGSLWYRAVVKTHKNVGGKEVTVACPKVYGLKCPICEYQVKRIKDGADKEEFKLLYPQERSLYWVIPIGHKDYKEDPMVWDMSDFLFQETLVDVLKENPENEDFFTLDKGKTATLRLKWKKIGKNNFPEVVDITFKKRAPYEEAILDELPSLDDMIKVMSYEELDAAFFDIDEEDAGKLKDTDDEEPPVRQSRRAPVKEEAEEEDPPPRRKPVKEEEEPPVRSRRTPVKEEEEEPPVRSRRAPAKEEEEEDTPPPRRSTRKTEPDDEAPKGGKDKCPHGHRFGADTDKFDECDKCAIWDDCIEAKEAKAK